MSQSKLQRNNGSAGRILWPFLIILLLGVAAVAVTASHASIAGAWRTAATHQPETYSELYFDNPARLPGYAPAKKRQTIRFSIGNHEHAKVVYRYQTTVTIGRVVTARTGSVALADGQTATEALSFIIPQPHETATILIKLAGTTQQLTFRSES